MSRVAYHEAAHATIAGKLGFRIHRAFISADGCSGAVELDEAFGDLDMQRWPIVCLSGAIAEAKYLGRADAAIVVHATTDYQKARMMAWAAHGDGADAQLDRWHALAGAYVELNWSIIQRIAAALLRQKELSGKELAPLLLRRASDR
jgi:hypothetical protein